MKTVILAAGEGRRLEPLTDVRPKPMLPVANKSLLEYVVEAAADAGVEEAVHVVGYKRQRIQEHFGDGDDWDVDIEYTIGDPTRNRSCHPPGRTVPRRAVPRAQRRPPSLR